MKRRTIVAALGLWLTGCTAQPLEQEFGLNHPANPRAAEAPSPSSSTTLAIDTAIALMPTDDSKPMPAHQHGSAAPATTPSTSPTTTALYVCPMHKEVASNTPGNCPKCGMKLVAKKNAATSDHGGHQ